MLISLSPNQWWVLVAFTGCLLVLMIRCSTTPKECRHVNHTTFSNLLDYKWLSVFAAVLIVFLVYVRMYLDARRLAQQRCRFSSFVLRMVALTALISVAILDVRQYTVAHTITANIFFSVLLLEQLYGLLHQPHPPLLQWVHYGSHFVFLIVYLCTEIGWFEVVAILSLILYFLHDLN